MKPVRFVGAGPGDPDLLTIKARAAIESADVVIYDEIIPREIVELIKGKRIRNVRGTNTFAQGIAAAKCGLSVVRLHAGDPTIFGHLPEKMEALDREGIPYEIIPGVTAATAAAAAAKVSLTHRWLANSVAIVKGNDPETPIPDADTVVLYMPKRELPGPRLLIEDALRTGDSAHPVRIAIHGAVANLKALPLYGQRIVVTRAESGGFHGRLRALGADVIAYPVIRIVPPLDAGPLEEAAANLSRYDWLVFTSANGVRSLFDRVRDLRTLRAKICAIGPATAAGIESLKLVVDVRPSEYVAESLLAALPKDLAHQRILLPRAAVARDIVPETLRRRGAIVDAVEAYRTVAPKDPKPLPESYDWVTFTSSSTVTNFLALAGRPAAKAASIGPITSETLRQQGIEPDVEASEHTTDGLAEAIVRYHKAL